ncbi:RsfA family transcriptional regulator [Virgibacillus sp. W0430]|uniref:RsfA family transcriptional regulator n=1 Tax=Virgibacillus sp. W0430 TaxID=3391580 RepID=UPI003F44B754
MNSTRQDAWTKDEDLVLAETVLRYIREGKTQLEAFKEVASRLSRTPAACGFRWNATIRKQYEDAILIAKEERKNGGQPEKISSRPVHAIHGVQEESTTIDSAIMLLEKMKDNFIAERTQRTNNEADIVQTLQQENERLTRQVARYHEAWKEMTNLWEWVQMKNEE